MAASTWLNTTSRGACQGPHLAPARFPAECGRPPRESAVLSVICKARDQTLPEQVSGANDAAPGDRRRPRGRVGRGWVLRPGAGGCRRVVDTRGEIGGPPSAGVLETLAAWSLCGWTRPPLLEARLPHDGGRRVADVPGDLSAPVEGRAAETPRLGRSRGSRPTSHVAPRARNLGSESARLPTRAARARHAARAASGPARRPVFSSSRRGGTQVP
jgi:hypothetical protein